MSERVRRPWSLPRLALVMAILGLVIWKVNFQVFLSHLNWKLANALLWVQPVIMVGLVLHALRLVLLLDLPLKSFAHALKALLLSQGGNLFLPARLSEILKVTYLHTHADVQITRGIAAIMLERAVDLLIFGLIAATSVALFATGRAGGGAVLMAVIGVAAVALAPWLAGRVVRVVSGLGWSRLGGLIEGVGENLRQGIRNPRFSGAFFLGVLTWLASACNVGIFLLLALPEVGTVELSLKLFIASTIGGVIPALPGGFGIYEAAAVLVLRPFGLSFEEALAFGLVLHLSQYVIPALGAMIVISAERSGISDLLNMMRKK